nr:uncharacterized protein LOC117849176 [Setaria viridis]
MELRHVPKKDNVDADELSKLASSRAPLPPRVFEERLTRPTAMVADHSKGEALLPSGRTQALPQEGSFVLPICSQEPSWMDDIRSFLKENILLEDDGITERIVR